MDPENDDVSSANAEIDRVRKAPQDRSPGLAVRPLICERICHYASNALVDGCGELVTKSLASCFVPAVHLKHFIFGLRSEDNIARHLWRDNFRRTSGHGTAETG